MDPYDEQRLRDEVLYLHSLWHYGHHHFHFHGSIPPYNPPRFKKPNNKIKTPKFKTLKPYTGKFSGKEWPVNPPPTNPPLNQFGWPELKLNPNPQPPRVPTPEELAKHNWNQVQIRALKAAKEFYSANDDDDVVDDDDDDDDDDEEEDGVNVEDEEYEFLWKLIDGDEEMKGYYVRHCGGGGEFLCLVCGGANEKNGKRFRDCVALVQHSVTIAKTKRRRSHRVYGRVVCKVLGWDIDRLPSSIVLDHKCCGLQGNDVKDLNNVMDDENLNAGTRDGSGTVDDRSMVCEDNLAMANVEKESNNNQVLKESEGYTGGAVNNLCRNLSSTMVLELQCDLQTDRIRTHN